MWTHRHIPLILIGVVFALLSLSCGVGAVPLAGSGAEEPAEPEEPAPPPAAPEEPAAEEEPPLEEEPDTIPPGATLAAPTEFLLLATTMPTGNALPTPTQAGVTPVPAASEPQPLIHEPRFLTLEYPPVIRTGDAGRIRLQLEVDDQGRLTPTAVVEGNVITGEVVEIPNLYETHRVVAEARLDMAGMEVQPPGAISETLTPGSSVRYYWSIRPQEAGSYEGIVWLHMRFIPKAGGDESRVPVSAQFIDIQVRSFLGLSGGMARGVGAVGSAVGTVLGFPFLDDLLRFLVRRFRR